MKLLNKLKSDRKDLINNLNENIAALENIVYEQQKEIERLQKENNQFADIGKMYSEIRAEAIKEFSAELFTRLKQYENYDTHYTYEILDRIESVEEFLLNNLVKEMVGDDK